MAAKIMDAGGVLRTLSAAKAKEGSALRTGIRLKVMDADGVTLRTVATFAGTLSLSVSPSTAAGARFGDGTCTTNAVTATPAGGLGPYSYSWAALSGDGTPSTPTAATTAFTAISVAPDALGGAFRCTCTDSSGQTATADVTATFDFHTPPS